VDNIYSHRSTQKYKKKPFVCHYWDCRLKGRPPGTKKSDDPNKKKRKRQARDRDLCDVKIKVTEYFPGARAMLGGDMESSTPASNPFAPSESAQNRQPASRSSGASSANQGGVPAQPGSDGARYYTIQRVNGNGANGKGDGTAGGHKHTIEESDRVKKNSIHRHLLREEKEEKKSQVRLYFFVYSGSALPLKQHQVLTMLVSDLFEHRHRSFLIPNSCPYHSYAYSFNLILSIRSRTPPIAGSSHLTGAHHVRPS